MEKRIVAPAYAAALMIFLFAVLDLYTGLRPIEVGNVDWRFGAVGFLSGSLMSFLFAGLIALAVATRFGHRALARVLGVLGFVAVLVLLVSTVGFVLDALQIRGRFQPNAANSFEVAMGKAAFKLVAGAAVAGVYGWAAWRAASHGVQKKGKGGAKGSRGEGGVLVSAAAEVEEKEREEAVSTAE